MNRNDLDTQVRTTLTSFEADYAIDAIVEDIVDAYGVVDIDTIDSNDYWAIVERHDTSA